MSKSDASVLFYILNFYVIVSVSFPHSTYHHRTFLSDVTKVYMSRV
jgi:hypothetical protein